jgi:A/G-specific adenine glycosylase
MDDGTGSVAGPVRDFLHFLFANIVYFAFGKFLNSKSKNSKLVAALLDWFAANARDLPWRRTRDPYAIWVSEIMLQQTQVKTVIPFWERWLRELPTIEAAATAPSAKIHKLWEGLGYYTRVRNLQKAAQQIANRRRDEFHESPSKNKVRNSRRSSVRFPEKFEDILALPGIGRYTAGAICSIAFNQPRPILDGNVIRVLTRIFGIAENPKEKETNKLLWQIAEALVFRAKAQSSQSRKLPAFAVFAPLREKVACSFLNQSLMELGALVCTPKNPQCRICPVKKLCVAFKENRVDDLPNLGPREAATARRFLAFVIERDGKFLVQQRPAGVVNAQLWEFPNAEITRTKPDAKAVFKNLFGVEPATVHPLRTVKHSITRYRITLEAFAVQLASGPEKSAGRWRTPAQMQSLAFTSAHRKVLQASRAGDGR